MLRHSRLKSNPYNFFIIFSNGHNSYHRTSTKQTDMKQRIFLNIMLIQQMLGYDPDYDFAKGIALAIDWYKEDLSK